MRKLWTWITGGAFLLLVGVVVVVLVGPERLGVPPTVSEAVLSRAGLRAAAAEADPMGVQFTPAERGDLVRTIQAPGQIEPRVMVNISSQVSAPIVGLPFREGQRVEAGDVVVRLDPQTLVAELEAARAQLRSEEARLSGAEAEVIEARLAFRRLEQLFETGDVTQAELETAEAAHLRAISNRDAIAAGIDIAKAGIEQAEEDLDNTTIVSPIAGTIIALNAEVGETAIVGTTNTAGSVLMEIADLSRMSMIAEVDESRIGPVRVGQGASIYLTAFPDDPYRGRVVSIGLKRLDSDVGSGYFEVEIEVDVGEELGGDAPLRSGFTATCDIEVEPFYDVIRVPTQAVVDRRRDVLPADQRSSEHVDPTATFAQVVFVESDGVARAVPVKAGPSDLTHTVVLAGLDEGREVVSGPFRVLASLQDGEPIAAEAELREGDGESTSARGGRGGGRRGGGGLGLIFGR